MQRSRWAKPEPADSTPKIATASSVPPTTESQTASSAATIEGSVDAQPETPKPAVQAPPEEMPAFTVRYIL
jgi:hypothetical protein